MERKYSPIGERMFQKIIRRQTGLLLLLGAFALAIPTLAFADGASHQDTLDPVPHNPVASGGSAVNGSAHLVRAGDFVIVRVHVDGAAPGLVHAQHIHGVGLHACPNLSRDLDQDGLINTAEGQTDYGPIVVSLTTSGDTSPASGLAVDRFPVANANGSYDYFRKLLVGTDIHQSVADNLQDFHIVTHGIDTNHNGAYDFSKGPSELNSAFPQEATVPAACGLIR